MIACKAAVCEEAGEDLVVKEVTVDPPEVGEVRVKIFYTGVCHTDEYFRSGMDDLKIFPTIYGHEGAGIVESIGEGVTSVEIGDHVIPSYCPQCRECELCKSPKTNFCEINWISTWTGTMPDGTTRFKDKDGNKLFHFMSTSTFCQYTVVSEIHIVKITEEAPLDKVCLLGCAITTGYGAVLNTLKVEEGSSVAVVGLGGVGLAAIMGAANVKASQIIAVDINPDKFEKALAFGATDTVNPLDYDGKELKDIISEMTDGIGVDYSLECVGEAKLMRQAFLATKPNGGFSCAIGATPGEQDLELASDDIQGRQITGTYFGGTKSRDQLPGLVDEYLSGHIKIDEFITHTFTLEEINEAFNAMKEGKCIKAVVKMVDDE
ncbi:unnamed protein product [Moneuplotes crassus]|uniref:Enoyl reductase (ER) domain-containing protein n=1 Tax=Euplotes crassus TaxID=5936 RepID=A0AAD1XIA2_EUPCR|nr:unnamed protein product [Moneuplotes crassus]